MTLDDSGNPSRASSLRNQRCFKTKPSIYLMTALRDAYKGCSGNND